MKRWLLLILLGLVGVWGYSTTFRREMIASHFYTLERECKASGVSISLAMSIIEEESRFNPSAKSKRPNSNGTIDYGYMGLNSAYIQWFIDMFGYDKSIKWDPINNPEHNIILGVRYIAWLSKRFPNRLELLYSYNWGPTNVSSGEKIPDRTVAYAKNVLSRTF